MINQDLPPLQSTTQISPTFTAGARRSWQAGNCVSCCWILPERCLVTYEESFLAFVGSLPPLLIGELNVLDDCVLRERDLVILGGSVIVDGNCLASRALCRCLSLSGWGGGSGFRRRGRGAGGLRRRGSLFIGVPLNKLDIVAGEETSLSIGIAAAPPVLNTG